MSFYLNSLAKTLQEKIAYFNNAGLSREAQLLQTRLSNIESKQAQIPAESSSHNDFQSPAVEAARKSLRAKIEQGAGRISELEKRFILENLDKAKTLKELEPSRVAYINRQLKASRAASSKSIEFGSIDTYSGPYNNEKTFCEVLKLVYSQDPLWIEDFKELYFSIMPSCGGVDGFKA